MYVSVRQSFMEHSLSHTAKSVKDWNSLQNQVVFEFSQEQVITTKLISALKTYFLESYIL